MTNKKVNDQKLLLETQDQELQISQNMSWHYKLLAVKQLEQEYRSIPWSEHIPKIIAMLEDIKNIDTSESETIVLSDFKVSLDSISVKGKVSRLWLLYYNNPDKNIKALLDKFSELGFLEDIRVQTYEKVEGAGYEFVLDAKVSNDAG